MKKNIITLGIVVFFIALITSCKNEQGEMSPPPPVKSVKVLQIDSNSGGLQRSISGVVVTSDQADLSFSVAGQVTEILVKSGESVKKGQALAKLDDKNYVLALKNAEANVSSAKANLVEKKSNLSRQVSLNEKNLAAQATVDSAQTGYESALSQLEVAESQYDISQRDLENTTLTAPFAGDILERLVDPFAEVLAGQTILRLQGSDGLEVELLMPETLIRDIAYGDTVEVSFPTLKTIIVVGEVTEIGAKVASGNAFPVSIKLSGQANSMEAGILPGMTAQVLFTFDNNPSVHELYTIPVSAIDMRVEANEEQKLQKGQVRIFVYDPQTGTARHRVVLVENIQNNDVVVYGGLQRGDMVIAAGVPFLSDGQSVQPWTLEYKKPAKLNPFRDSSPDKNQ